MDQRSRSLKSIFEKLISRSKFVRNCQQKAHFLLRLVNDVNEQYLRMKNKMLWKLWTNKHRTMNQVNQIKINHRKKLGNYKNESKVWMDEVLMVNYSINWVTASTCLTWIFVMIALTFCFLVFNNRCPLTVWYRLLGNHKLEYIFMLMFTKTKCVCLLSLRWTCDGVSL